MVVFGMDAEVRSGLGLALALRINRSLRGLHYLNL